jgi:O-antigen/teichoic acid export membrane protein
MLVILTKDGSFILLSKIKILISILIASTQLLFGWLNMGYWGLIYSTIVVQIIAFTIYFRPFFIQYSNSFALFTRSDMKSVMIDNWRMPLIVLPGNFINNLTQSLPVFFLGRIDYQVLGYFSLARRIIDFPLKFITAAAQRLYIKELTDEVQTTGLGQMTFRKNLKLYGIIATILFLGIITLTKPLVPILFGAKWTLAVPYIILLGFLFSVRFVFGSLSFVMVLGKAPKFDIYWQVGFGLIITLVFLLSDYLSWSPLQSITIYTIAGVFSYFTYGFLCYKVANSRRILSIS